MEGVRLRTRTYRLIDRYTAVKPDGFSLGETILWDGDQTKLFIAYHGYYPKEVTPFLRQVLRDTYAAEKFEGGRGSNTEGDDLYYVNQWRWHGITLKDFNGSEYIVRKSDDARVGYHHFWGTFFERPMGL